MLVTGRRMPVRALQQASHSALAQRGAVRLNPASDALLRPQHTRSFFGLKDWFFGKSGEEEKPVEAAKAAEAKQHKPTPATVAAAPASSPSTVAEESVPAAVIQGSLDDTQFVVGKYARLADGGVMATCGKTMLLTTVVSDSGGKRGRDFLPLMVDYRVKSYASGLIPDTARRREFSGNDDEILQSRVIDRVIRPLFPRDYYDDTQVIATVQSFDGVNDPLVVAVNSTSAALAVSDIPWNGPVGCVRVVEIDGQLVVNPTIEQRQRATLDLIYAASETRTLMIEASGDQVPEDRMIEALQFAQESVGPIIEGQKKLVQKFGKPKRSYASTVIPPEVMAKANEIGLEDARAAVSEPKYTKQARQQSEKHLYGKIISGLRAHFQNHEEFRNLDDAIFQMAAHDVFHHALRSQILSGEKNQRLDGRFPFTIRNLYTEVDVLPMAHGSSVFTRGDTQALCSVTLGPLDRGLKLRSSIKDTSDEGVQHAMLHYEFPPYCVNETGKIGGTNRRMIGHGALAEKALLPVIPSIDTFPYTVRMTSETMGSDGSSSMATVCGVSMALMDAGVPIAAPVAGISMGLITEGDPFDGQKEITNYKLITDILGTEDHYGDMDYKIAGTDAGITAIQLDVKLPGIPLEILCKAVHHAKKARINILRKMHGTIHTPREQLKNSPTGEIHTGIEFSIPTSNIGRFIGAGGANIREAEQTLDVSVSIDRKNGQVRLVGTADKVAKAKEVILQQMQQYQNQNGNEAFFRKGDRYTMRVTEIMDFGAILESTAPTKNRGFVHITELSPNRIENIHSELSVGQELEFVCIQEGSSGKMSLKAALGVSEAAPAISTSSVPTATTTTDATSEDSSAAHKRRPRFSNQTRPAKSHSHRRHPRSGSNGSSESS